MNYKECVEYLINIPKFSKNKSPENTEKILYALGKPEEKLKVIHVAGTNGKGSTCAFINSILLKLNKDVGMFTSPHLVKINERIKINGKDISDTQFLDTFLKVKGCIEELFGDNYIPTFFEYMFLIGITAFADSNVEYAIFEVGLGGRLDATNYIKKPKVSVITSISMDHMEILWDTIEKIAVEKAGIIKDNVPVVYYGQNPICKKLIDENANKHNADTIAIFKDDIKIVQKENKVIDFYITNMYDKYGLVSIPFSMEYQTINAYLAISAIEVILKSEEIQVDDHIIHLIKEGLLETKWPGRMEEVSENVFIDGAHNYEGMEAFCKHVSEVSKQKKIYILFSVVKEKEYHEMMDLILEINNCGGFYVAPVKNSRALAVTDMGEYLRENSVVPVYMYNDLKTAYFQAKKALKTNEILFCTGSLYMVGELKNLEEEND